MTAVELLALYDEHLRVEPEVADADEVVRIGPLLAATSWQRGRGLVTYQHIPVDADLDRLVEAAVAHYAADARVGQFEWKTRGHDHLPGLDDVLRRHGFVLGDVETVMAGEAEAVLTAASPLPGGYGIERATTAATLREAEALAGGVFGDEADRSARRADTLVARLEAQPDSFESWLVRDAAGAVVCSGRVDFVADTPFAGLWGGACADGHRGRGLYRAITAARARSALARGHRYLHSDCTALSRPILQRAGLVPITTTTPATWHRPSH